MEFHVKRCFVALPLDAITRADMGDVLRGLDIEGMRPTGLENLHITVKFLGDVEDPDLPGVIEAVREAIRGVGRFELAAERLLYLPDARRPRVLAAEMDRPETVMRLYDQIEDAMEAVGFRREGRAYRPHVTLGRFRKPPRHVPDVSMVLTEPVICEVERVVLMESVLERGGAVYAELASFDL
ncbi:MAG: RNA 2',3'-cyclic phosphodiesterase [Planctomycetes bacterium]|nr:RNA 2',3'-cyclic phosphodiesterase [Planctomycetota bacterium]